MGITAFAFVSLASVIEFHLWRSNTWTLSLSSNAFVLFLAKKNSSQYHVMPFRRGQRPKLSVLSTLIFSQLNDWRIFNPAHHISKPTHHIPRTNPETLRARDYYLNLLMQYDYSHPNLWRKESWDNSEFSHITLEQTTSVLTATTLKYTIGAGITAGAGTRLVLQLLLW